MFCVTEVYRYSSHFPTKSECVCVCVVSLRASVVHAVFLVWIVINKSISRRKEEEMLAIRTKRSTSCIVYYRGAVTNS